jgi:hypothetical protein
LLKLIEAVGLMDAAFRSLLPLWLADLVDQTEAATGLPIDVVVNGARPANAPLRAMISASYTRIETPSVHRFVPSSVFHELMHIRRIMVDGVPRLGVADGVPDDQWSPQLEEHVTSVDNAIEHLVIVPKELEHFPERKEHWEQVVRRNCQTIAAGQGTPQELDASAIGLWVFVRHALPGSHVEIELSETLVLRGLRQKAVDAAADVLPRLADKRDLTRAWFTATGQAATLVHFEFIDPHEQTTEYEPLCPGQPDGHG